MDSGAVASYAAPKTSDSTAVTVFTTQASGHPAPVSPAATFSYISRVCGELATGSTAITGIRGMFRA